MVVYDLVCPSEHRFEGWFRSESDYHDQHNGGLLRCPFCDSDDIKKIPTASYINMGRATQKPSAHESTASPALKNADQLPAQQEFLKQLQEYVEQQTEDVGKQFAEEAKKMHYGETKSRNIRGQATVEEMVELHDEGIEAIPLPFEMSPNKKLN